MSSDGAPARRIGWIGLGRMGTPMVARLLDAGYEVSVYNRTREKADPLEERGCFVVERPLDLAGCEIVFTMVAGSEDFKEVTLGPAGVLADANRAPAILIDSSTVSAEASEAVRTAADAAGTALLAAPVSGNPNVVRAGRLTLVVSGPPEAYAAAKAVLDALGRGTTYVGEGTAPGSSRSATTSRSASSPRRSRRSRCSPRRAESPAPTSCRSSTTA